MRYTIFVSKETQEKSNHIFITLADFSLRKKLPKKSSLFIIIEFSLRKSFLQSRNSYLNGGSHYEH